MSLDKLINNNFSLIRNLADSDSQSTGDETKQNEQAKETLDSQVKIIAVIIMVVWILFLAFLVFLVC